MADINYIQKEKNIQLAYRYLNYQNHSLFEPEIIFLSGFRSDMQGKKANFIHDFCCKRSINYLRFDYSGHGNSSGDFQSLTLSNWIEDTDFIIQKILTPKRPLLLIASSMGGWIALKLLSLLQQTRPTALIMIAPAPDFASKLFPLRYRDDSQTELKKTGYLTIPCAYSAEGSYLLSQKFFDDADQNNLLNDTILYNQPVRILQGMQDQEVPYKHAITVSQALTSEDIMINLIKKGDHSLSALEDLNVLQKFIEEMLVFLRQA